MPEKNERGAEEGTLELEQELQRERREHALIDEEKLGMDELEEERLRRDLAHESAGTPAKK
ncbi:hypothetical protein D3C81_600850 [compost metagenome]|uniref:hypothetical protein n=1 Tax=unclassified Janthinobacterium TaxID=2610881 RepID=UPI000C841250|nr:hypothetical protein [Janthinobacterium sp. AD80]PMQ14559.1 hypothetical protein JaAD80_20285 [Janthinobacterium sp. AD80]